MSAVCDTCVAQFANQLFNYVGHYLQNVDKTKAAFPRLFQPIIIHFVLHSHVMDLWLSRTIQFKTLYFF